MRELVRTYTELSDRHDVVSANAAFNRYVSSQVRGFGLGSSRPSSTLPSHPRAARPSEGAAAPSTTLVRGQQLRQIAAQAIVAQLTWSYGALVLFVTLAGVAWQARRHRRFNLLEDVSCSPSNR